MAHSNVAWMQWRGQSMDMLVYIQEEHIEISEGTTTLSKQTDVSGKSVQSHEMQTKKNEISVEIEGARIEK